MIDAPVCPPSEAARQAWQGKKFETKKRRNTVSISKVERRRRQEAERSRRYYERKKAAEAARQAEAARAEEAERRARHEIDRAKPKRPCAVPVCDRLAQNDICGHWVCTGHSHELLRGRSFEELKPLNTAQGSLPGGDAPSGSQERPISDCDGEKPPSEPLESSLERYREAAKGQRWLGTMLGFSDGRPAHTAKPADGSPPKIRRNGPPGTPRFGNTGKTERGRIPTLWH